MRVSCIYLIATLGTVSMLAGRPSNGQGLDRGVTIGMNHESARALLEKIEAVTGYQFVFMTELIDPYTDISFPAEQRTIRGTLTLAFTGTKLNFQLRGTSIVISEMYATPANSPATTSILIENHDNAIPISGMVKDKEGEPLTGVSVVVKGTTIGTSTDTDGKFIMDVPTNAEALVFSFIGLRTVEMSINGRTFFEVQMETDMVTLNEVVISGGYYTTTDRLKIGTIVKVPAREIENQPVTSPLMALQGKVPGLDVTPTSGVPGSAVKIQIRGRNSLRINSANSVANSPLYVIDGVPIDPSPLRSGSETTTTVGDGYDPLSAINPANIESIEILKDADATSIYGSRGANGVILITTKRAVQSGKTDFNVNVYSGVGKITHEMDVLNTQQYLMMRREALANDGAEPGIIDFDINGAWDSTRYTNWQKELLGGTAHVTDVQTGFSGGSGNTSFRVNGGYHKESTVYSSDFGFRLLSGNLNVTHSSSDQRFRASLSVNYGAKKSNVFESTTFMTQALQLPPHAPQLYNDDGTLNWQYVPLGPFKFSSFDNPLAKLRNTNEMVERTLFANANISYDLGGGFQVKSNIGYTDLTGDELIKRPLSAIPPAYVSNTTTGSATFGLNRRQSWIAEPQVVYYKEFGAHKIDFLFGGTWQQSTSVFQKLFASGYTSDLLMSSLAGATFTAILSDVSNEFKYMAAFFRLGYNWGDKYLLSFTGRRDGSSRFGPGKRFGNFGSVGAAWVFANEGFIKSNTNVLTQGKLRASFGVTGNDQIGDYIYMDTYSISQAYKYQNGINLLPTALFNSEFSWEETKKLEAALEVGFLNDRVFWEVDWYRNRSSNQLVDYALPYMTGFASVFRNFPATVENSGVEAILRVTSIQNEHLILTTSVNIAANRNKLVEFPGIETSSYRTLYKVGEPLSVTPVYHYVGINPVTGLHEVEDVDENGTFDFADMHFAAPSDRQYYGGLTNTLSVYGFDLSFTFQFSKQKKRAFPILAPAGSREQNVPVEVLDRWRQEGDVASNPKFSQSFDAALSTNNFISSDGNIADASFIRLKTLSLGYRLPSSWLKAAHLRQARIFVQCQNLITFTDYIGLDPETEGALPPLRMVSGGLSLQF